MCGKLLKWKRTMPLNFSESVLKKEYASLVHKWLGEGCLDFKAQTLKASCINVVAPKLKLIVMSKTLHIHGVSILIT